MKIWKENNYSQIQKLLEYILSIWKDDGGYSYSKKNNIAYHEFLCSIKEKEFLRSVVHKTLTDMKSASKNSLKEFSEIYEGNKNKQPKSNISTTEWIFYIPIEAEFDEEIIFPVTITILGYKYQFVKNLPFASNLVSNFPFRLFEYEKSVKEYATNPKKIFLSVKCYGNEWDSAWGNITPSFDVLRGIIEFSFSFRGFQISSQSKPRATIPHPKWVVIRDDKNIYDGSTFNVIDYRIISKFNFTSKRIKTIRNNSRLLQKLPPNNSSKHLLISCMRLYSDAMDGYYHYTQFLGLWNIAEAICLSEDFGGESKKVAKRLARFGRDIGLVSTGYSNILDTLSYKRNNLVHKGISTIYDDDINHLKFAIDTALLWLYKSISKLDTVQHLSHYYRLRDLNRTELNSINETIKVIRKSR